MLPEDFVDPELLPVEGSEIEAAVDVSIRGSDDIFRPVFIGQINGDMIQITYEDAVRLNKFLTKAIPFIKEFSERNLQ